AHPSILESGLQRDGWGFHAPFDFGAGDNSDCAVVVPTLTKTHAQLGPRCTSADTPARDIGHDLFFARGRLEQEWRGRPRDCRYEVTMAASAIPATPNSPILHP
ncbi:MAG: hypothetical protein ACLQDM_03480, partial [Bradyrhizobium sp.]